MNTLTTRLIASTGALLCLSGCVDPSDGPDEPFQTLLQGRVEAAPATLNFDATRIGEASTRTVILTNTGEGTLRLSRPRIEEDAGDDLNELEPAGDWPAEVALGPGEDLALAVRWSPRDATRDTGTLRLATNDPAARVFVVPITTPALEPDLDSPRLVQFPRVPTGQTQWLLTPLTNSGQAPLQLKRVLVSPADAAEFTVTFPAPGHDRDPERDLDAPPDVLAPGESTTARVTFSPTSTNPASAEVIVDSNDPDSPQYRVRLSGNAGVPILEVGGVEDAPAGSEAAHLLDFGPSTIDQRSTRTVRLRNAGTERLDVDDVALVGDANGAFTLEAWALPGGLERPPFALEPDAEANVVVGYTPDGESRHDGRLVIASNDPIDGLLEVDLRGTGSTNACPVAIAEGRVLGSGAMFATQIDTLPLENIELSALRSFDDGEVRTYQWEVIGRPRDSTAGVTNAANANARLFLDLAGDYLVELRVFDDLNVPSCASATVAIRAQPDEDIHVQLVWDTPADRDQGDIVGTDLDLHYLHPLGSWDRQPWDIYWNNKEANWGNPGRTDDDPSLDIDDTDGAGPENVNHDNPESGNTYRVGVYYYSDNGFGPSYATVRVYIEGALTYEKRDKYLEREDVFWDVAGVVWPLKQVIETDTLRQGFPTR
jgi:hypothetical protein